MITNLLVIQEVSVAPSVAVYQLSSSDFQWTFENRRTKSTEDEPFFPFTISGEYKKMVRPPGAETSVYKRQNGEIVFADDYGVRGGMVIGILLPENYVPDILKFKDKPHIPAGLAGQLVSRTPGNLEILYNHLEKKSAIIFHIHENILFGFSCTMKEVQDEFPRTRRLLHDDLFDATFSREHLNVEAITTEDLLIINETNNEADIIDVRNALNDLLTSLKNGKRPESTANIQKVGSLLSKSMSAGSDLISLIDSYNDGGAAKEFVNRVYKYITI